MKITISSESNLGKVRTNNEDLGLVQNTLVCDTPVKSYFDLDVEAPVIAAIADGMGGLDDGEIASMMVIDSLRDWLETAPPDAGSEEIIASFNRWIPITNDKIISACHTRGMGTTLVGLVFTRQQCDALFRRICSLIKLTRQKFHCEIYIFCRNFIMNDIYNRICKSIFHSTETIIDKIGGNRKIPREITLGMVRTNLSKPSFTESV